jgi:hypothetical protein
MQTVNNLGEYGPLKAYSEEDLKQELAKPDTAHVEVFEGTPENIAYKTKLLGVKKRYQKAKK